MTEKIIMFSDGGSRGNPGPAGIGVYIETLDKKYGEYIGEATNNVAEYAALIFGLKKLKQLLGKDKTKQYEVECYLDSELVVKQINHEYKLKEEYIQKNFIEIWNLMLDFKNVRMIHILREKNKVADAMVNEALDAREKQGNLL
ncbi:MAG: ribonuclease HI family protein [Candidatus Pacebacteria bacterium]|nr:ribonuclease HI family protein [Candidatus Paceibacterota bacterium]MDR3583547.1 ribonuclease HI family protein [Candidatus Paceibacterota bacterium]